MRKLSLIILFFTAPILLFSQAKKITDTFEDAYIVSLKGDTIIGQIKTTKTKQTDFYQKINFKDKSNKIRLYTPDKITGYWFREYYYTSAYHNNKLCYFRVLSKGKAALLEISFSFNDAGEIVDMLDYCVIPEGKDAEMIVLEQKGLKKQLKSIFKTNKELSRKINDQKEILFNTETLQGYFTEFNTN